VFIIIIIIIVIVIVIVSIIIITISISYLKSNVARVRLSTKPREDCWLKLPDHPAMLAYFTQVPSS
jgi:flagellar basal body-associated protein FliL